jgi:hypothetical protein
MSGGIYSLFSGKRDEARKGNDMLMGDRGQGGEILPRNMELVKVGSFGRNS